MKTINDAKKELSKEIAIDFIAEANLELGFQKGVEFAQRWIPVKEELPEINHKIVLLKHKSGSLRLLLVDDYLTQVIIKDNYTHWRPIEYK